jgi:drug/metabolite transporter (DMT)-like permease
MSGLQLGAFLRVICPVKDRPSNRMIAAGLVAAIVLWGQNNAATKYLAGFWPPVTIGVSRFLGAGVILLGVLHWTDWLGRSEPVSRELKRRLWRVSLFSLATYIVCYSLAIKFTSASNVALHLGTAPVWALIWEERPRLTWRSVQSYAAALLALTGVFILVWPNLRGQNSPWLGDLFGLGASILWTSYGRDCRALSKSLLPPEVSACTFWRAGVILLPVAVMELLTKAAPITANLVLIQLYCILASGVVAFILWNNGLRWWPTSRVYLFNNLIPISTMLSAAIFIHEPISPTFWVAMFCIVGGVLLGQTNWQKMFSRWLPCE